MKNPADTLLLTTAAIRLQNSVAPGSDSFGNEEVRGKYPTDSIRQTARRQLRRNAEHGNGLAQDSHLIPFTVTFTPMTKSVFNYFYRITKSGRRQEKSCRFANFPHAY